MNRKRASIVVLTLLLTSTLTVVFDIRPARAEPRTWIVDDDGPADFHTIQEAVDAASSGDIISVKAGTYYESISWSGKSLMLIGENKTTTIIDANRTGANVIDVRAYTPAHRVAITGFTIKNGFRSGIFVLQLTSVITDNIITSNGCHGIYNFAGYATSPTICNNTVTSNGLLGDDWGTKWGGIVVVDFGNGVLSDNTISNNGGAMGGIMLAWGRHTLRRNNMSGNLHGFGCLWTYGHDIDASNVIDGKPMYYLKNQDDITIDSSTFPDIGFLGIVDSRNVTVKDLDTYGVIFAGTHNSTIRNVTSSKSYAGIFLVGSTNNTVESNLLTNNSYGINMYGSKYNIVNNNTMSNNFEGFALHASGNILRNNHMDENDYGFGLSYEGQSLPYNDVDTSNLVNGKPIYYLTNQNNIVIDPNSFPNIGYLGLVSSVNVTIRNLELTRNEQGLYLAGVTQSTIENNTFLDNYNQLTLVGSSGNTIKGNTIRNNLRPPLMIQKGVYLIGGPGNTLYHNNFFNNILQATTHSGQTWDNGAEGNYWSDYEGEDLDGDGIGDVPYIDLYHSMQDNYPLMEPWSPTRTFNATKDSETYPIVTLSNSTIASFNYNGTSNEISFNATGPLGTTGFCNMTIPKELGEPSAVLVDGISVDYTQTENATHYFLDFTYQHSTHTITIIIGAAPSDLIEKLIEDVEHMNLQQGIDNSLDVKLEATLAALEALNAEQRNDAVNKLYAFMNEVEAQRGKKLTEEQADYLTSEAQRIIDLIEG